MSEIYAVFAECLFMKIIYIARNKNSIELLREKMAKDSEKMKPMENGIIGLPWKHVEATFQKISGEQALDCLLPSSSSALLSVNRKRWSDLTLLGSNECNDLKDTDQKRYLEERYNFYKGKQVSWINIALSDESNIDRVKRHVVKRKPAYEQLKRRLAFCLNSKEKIEIIKVFYQPGAGASTLTRHVLWNFKSENKCAIVSNVTTKTLEQIREFYNYEEDGIPDENLKPVLLLLDLPNDDQCRALLNDMHIQRHNNRLRCVVIHCHKIHLDNQGIDPTKEVLLKQNLSNDDKEQFIEIHRENQWIKELNVSSPETDDSFLPDSMLAFLVFYNNFMSDYIKDCVSEYIQSEELRPSESSMLKYIALLNVYYDESPEIPGSFFDSLFQSTSFKKESSVNTWWTSLSAPFRLLCKFVIPDDQFGTVRSFMIFHPLLAKEILVQLMKKDDQSLSEACQEYLQSNVFKSKQAFSRNIVVVKTRNMFKKRKQWDEDETYDKTFRTFSRVIQDIIKQEKQPIKAITVLKTAFELLELDGQKDPFLAQQIARLFKCTKDFKEAYQYSEKAIAIQKDNSYLLDTMGQIHKSELEYKFSKYEMGDLQPMSVSECKPAIELARNAVSCFQESLRKNKKEASVNIYGIGNEIEVFEKLLILLQCTDLFSKDDGREKLHLYLQIEGNIPDESKYEWEDHHSFLKQLFRNMEHALEEADLMLTMLNPMNDSSECAKNRDKTVYLFNILYQRQSYESFLSKLPKSTRKIFSKSQLNRLHVKTYGGLSFQKIFKLKNDVLKDIWQLLHENVNENNKEFDEFDVKTLLIVSMAMIIKNVDTCGRINATYISDLCFQIKGVSRNPMNRHIANLFLSMLMWPRDNMEIDYDHKIYTQVLDQLKEEGRHITKKDQVEASRVAEYCNAGKFSTHFKMATHFLLGKNKGLQAFIQYNNLPMSSHRDHEFWNDSEVKHKLMKISGVVKGKTILAFNEKLEGEKNRIAVKIAFPSNNESEELADFYLGFSWGGPIAYNVTLARSQKDRTDNAARRKTEEEKEKKEIDIEKPLNWETFRMKRTILENKLKNSRDKGEVKKIKDELKHLKERYKQSKEATQMDLYEDL